MSHDLFLCQSGHYLQCEIYPGLPHVLTYIDACGALKTERFHDGKDLESRWNAIQRKLNATGWAGPMGRDPRA